MSAGPQLRRYQQFIDGAWRDPSSGEWLETFDPYRGRVWALIPRGGAEDASLAAQAAHRAARHGAWSRTSPGERAAALRRIGDVLRERWGELVAAEVRDNGKRIVEARAQLAGLHIWFEHCAGQAEGLGDTVLPNGVPGIDNRLRHEPFGAVLAITPWNSPLMIAAWKLAPALAAGNAVVIKPSEHASASTLELARLVDAAGLPSGVVNVVTGLGGEAGEALVAHPLIAKVSFTGSDRGGVAVAEAAARGLKPVTLELGGKSPQIVFADADMSQAVKGLLAGVFLSNGQTCVAGSRLIVEDSIHDEVVERLVERVARLRFGDPMDPATEIGPLANASHHEKVMAMIGTARAEGAACVCGGKTPDNEACRDGWFVEPTIFTGVAPTMRLWREEVFGPVLSVMPFRDEEEALALANDTDYGLAAGIWTSDAAKAERLAAGIEAGTVYVNHYRSVSPNSPVGGYKRSGYGRELGPDAIRDFLQVKSVWVGSLPMADPFPDLILEPGG